MGQYNKNKNKNKMCVTITKRDIKILSWNIQSPSSTEGNKFENDSFQRVIMNHDFACLQEIRRDVHLTGFRSICSLRKNKKSGGVGILIRNELVDGTELVKNESNPDYIICRLDKNFFNLDKDLYIINVYVKPQNSSACATEHNGLDTIKLIETTINDLRNHGDVLLCGDFNSRIGHDPGMIECESTDYIPLPSDYEPDEFIPRNSLDTSRNTYGTHFINLIKNNQLVILNGRTLGDFQGNFTSIQKNGCTVIDYMATSTALASSVNYFKVLEFTEHSDHRPLSLEIRCKRFSLNKFSPLQDTYEPAPCRFIFNDDNKDSFICAQSSNSSKEVLNNLQSKIDEINTTETHNSDSLTASINSINNLFTEHLQNLATSCFKKTKPQCRKSLKSNNPWFNWQARLAKRELRKATSTTDSFPSSDFIRSNFYLVKGNYKRILSKSQTEFFSRMNTDVENGKVLNWQAFKKLKQQKQDKINFDSYDMQKFETFFGELYSDKHTTISDDQKEALIDEADKLNSTATDPETLNKSITTSEVSSAIKCVKSGKASSTDMICNEFLKCLDNPHIRLLANMFNICLSKNVYPWNVSIISPLHKKGCKSDPDNYRAVAVSSVLGKLFSSILLERLIHFRLSNSPDPPNQLGFTKKAQTYDHVLTMQTIASKYKKLHKPVFAVFVDFKKAFDSVCRQALFLKLAKNGVTGNFYGVLKHMYANSYAHIKLSGHLSNKFKIRKGTEQGHPLSPDLFKIFISDLSPLLEFSNCPILSDKLVSHLLWADDLILLSLDANTAQRQLNALENFCTRWGIEINELKTQTVVFGEKFLLNNTAPSLYLNKNPLKNVDSYCYLGIILHKTGSVSYCQNDLKYKAMRAFFGLKRSVIRSKLSFKSLSTLFDSLIKPILLYGAPIWVPNSSVNKAIIKCLKSTKGDLVKAINRSVQEKLHLSYFKWALGVHRKASNIGVWGDSGRYPLIYQAIRLTLNYYKRISSANPNSFVSAALRDQKALKLPWYRNIKPLLKLDNIYSADHVSAFKTLTSKSSKNMSNNTKPIDSLSSKSKSKFSKSNLLLHSNFRAMLSNSNTILAHPKKSKKFRVNVIMEALRNNFESNWNHVKSHSSKLSYYHSIKKKFNREIYLDLVKGFSRRLSTTRLRISAHDYKIERGRYKNILRENRICDWCKTCMGVDMVEDEKHVLFSCDLYQKHRAKLLTNLNKAIKKVDENGELESFKTNIILTPSNLQSYLMPLLSPDTSIAECEAAEHINNFIKKIHLTHDPHPMGQLLLNDSLVSSLKERQSYVVNCVSTFIFKCSEELQKFSSKTRIIKENPNVPNIRDNHRRGNPQNHSPPLV